MKHNIATCGFSATSLCCLGERKFVDVELDTGTELDVAEWCQRRGEGGASGHAVVRLRRAAARGPRHYGEQARSPVASVLTVEAAATGGRAAPRRARAGAVPCGQVPSRGGCGSDGRARWMWQRPCGERPVAGEGERWSSGEERLDSLASRELLFSFFFS